MLFDGNPTAFRFFNAAVRFKETHWRARADGIWNMQKKHDFHMERQLNLASALSCIAPAHHLRVAVTSLARTDFESNARFMEAARAFRSQFLESLESRGYFTDHVISFYSRRNPDEVLSEQHWEQRRDAYLVRRDQGGEDIKDILDPQQWGPLPAGIVPGFQYDYESVSWDTATWSILILFVMMAVVLSAGTIIFTRYDVR